MGEILFHLARNIPKVVEVVVDIPLRTWEALGPLTFFGKDRDHDLPKKVPFYCCQIRFSKGIPQKCPLFWFVEMSRPPKKHNIADDFVLLFCNRFLV